MKALRLPFLVLAVVGLAGGIASAPAQAPGGKAYLLHVTKGQVATDTGQDDKTKPELVEEKALGGKAMKVAFAPGDSFGARGKTKNWKPYARLRFDAFVPGSEPVNLELTVIHGRSSNYNTRVVAPIKLKPGKNEVQIGIDDLTNVNGSAPDLANVIKWYIADISKKGPTVLFGDIYLEGGSAPAAPMPGGPAGAQPLVGYRIKGKVGNLPVDLTITPFVVPASATGTGTAASVHGDPARLARIRAAKMPKIDKPILFDTPEADAILSALEVYPPDNPFNLVIEEWPLHPDSAKIIGSIGADKFFRYNPDMGFVLIPPDQKKVDVKIVGYPGESDKGPFPVPDNTPIEGWPVHYKDKKVTLEDVQRNTLKEKGDRHAIVLDPTNRRLYEFFVMQRNDGSWQAAQSSVFDLRTNALRPDGWTSADAAGLPIFPATVRYDELKRGIVEHAMRVTVRRSRKDYVYPATHHAGHGTETHLPRMGERLRLKKDFDISGFSPEVQAILRGLKKYGMFVADNGIDWAISVTPDPRIKNLHEEFRKVKGSDFEVVQAPAGYQPPVPE